MSVLLSSHGAENVDFFFFFKHLSTFYWFCLNFCKQVGTVSSTSLWPWLSDREDMILSPLFLAVEVRGCCTLQISPYCKACGSLWSRDSQSSWDEGLLDGGYAKPRLYLIHCACRLDLICFSCYRIISVVLGKCSLFSWKLLLFNSLEYSNSWRICWVFHKISQVCASGRSTPWGRSGVSTQAVLFVCECIDKKIIHSKMFSLSRLSNPVHKYWPKLSYELIFCK